MSTVYWNSSSTVPIITHPGGSGWPDPPKTTQAEHRLYGPEFAPPIRLLGAATVALEDAYSLLCKAVQDEHPATTDEQETAQERYWREVIQPVWDAKEACLRVLSSTAETAIVRQREFRQCDGNEGTAADSTPQQ